jgi:hypothetical protein
MSTSPTSDDGSDVSLGRKSAPDKASAPVTDASPKKKPRAPSDDQADENPPPPPAFLWMANRQGLEDLIKEKLALETEIENRHKAYVSQLTSDLETAHKMIEMGAPGAEKRDIHLRALWKEQHDAHRNHVSVWNTLKMILGAFRQQGPKVPLSLADCRALADLLASAPTEEILAPEFGRTDKPVRRGRQSAFELT